MHGGSITTNVSASLAFVGFFHGVRVVALNPRRHVLRNVRERNARTHARCFLGSIVRFGIPIDVNDGIRYAPIVELLFEALAGRTPIGSIHRDARVRRRNPHPRTRNRVACCLTARREGQHEHRNNRDGHQKPWKREQ